MKRNLAWFFLGLIALLGIAAAVNMSAPIYIQNSDTETVQIRVRTGAAQTSPWLEFVETNATRFSLPATGIIPTAYGGTGAATPAAAKLAFGIQSGTNIISSDSRVTNTFATAFATAPFVVMNRFTAGGVTNNTLVSVSTTNFIAWGQTNSPFHWIAVGAP
jgi:hypothetical protein